MSGLLYYCNVDFVRENSYLCYLLLLRCKQTGKKVAAVYSLIFIYQSCLDDNVFVGPPLLHAS